MNKFQGIILTVLIAFGGASASAEYASMEFKTLSGESRSIGLDNLRITFSNGQLIASNGTENASFNLSDLSSMEFSNFASGMESAIADNDSETEVFAIEGVRLGKFASVAAAENALGKGIYIFRFANGKTLKKHIAR